MDIKNILIEIPTWLGDAVMTTPAIQNIVNEYPKANLIVFGSFVSTKIFKYHPNVKKIIIDDSKSKGNRVVNLYKLAKSIDNIDIAFSFRRNITTKLFLFFVKSSKKYIYKRYTKEQKHQVIRYNDFINISLNINTIPKDLKIYLPSVVKKDKKLLGINAGATYGSAKRWYPKEFAKVSIELSNRYDIVIFGGKGEVDIAKDIEDELIQNNITNYKNLASKTSVEELISMVSSLDLFITNDSGPMHLAAAFKIPTISIFGPTKYIETSQWNNENSVIVKKDYSCMPCMKRKCHLIGSEYHKCMKDITHIDVLDKIKELKLL